MTRLTRRTLLKGFGTAALGASALGLAGSPIERAAALGGETVIVIVAPQHGDPYYAEVRRALLSYCATFVAAVTGPERVIVVADRQTRTELVSRIPGENLLTGNIGDIWIRDFGPVGGAANSVKFSYRPQYLSAATAGWVESSYLKWQRKIGFEPVTTDVVFDGGNLVCDDISQAVTTERLYEDNPNASPDELVETLKRLLSLERVAVLPQIAGDITGHADGMVAWLDPSTLAVASYEEPVRSTVLSRLDAALPGVRKVEIPDAPTGRMWRGWPSAAGIYANGFATAHSVFIPVYDMPADDDAVAAFAALTDKPVIPVPCAGVAHMGGAVRCLTWVLRGAEADRLLAYHADFL